MRFIKKHNYKILRYYNNTEVKMDDIVENLIKVSNKYRDDIQKKYVNNTVFKLTKTLTKIRYDKILVRINIDNVNNNLSIITDIKKYLTNILNEIVYIPSNRTSRCSKDQLKDELTKLNQELSKIDKTAIDILKAFFSKAGLKLKLPNMLVELINEPDYERYLNIIKKYEKYFEFENDTKNFVKSIQENKIKSKNYNFFESQIVLLKDNDYFTKLKCFIENDYRIEKLLKGINDLNTNSKEKIKQTYYTHRFEIKSTLKDTRANIIDQIVQEELFDNSGLFYMYYDSINKSNFLKINKKYINSENKVYIKKDNFVKYILGKYKNKLINSIILKGKLSYCEKFFDKENIDSNELQKIKSIESFTKENIIAIAFASNTLLNTTLSFLEREDNKNKDGIEALLKQDILTNKWENYFSSNEFNEENVFKNFILKLYPDMKKEEIKSKIDKNSIINIRKCMYDIRNQMYHFRGDSFKDIISNAEKTDFTCIKDLLCSELNKVEEYQIKKLYAARIFEFFDDGTISNILKNIKFNVCENHEEVFPKYSRLKPILKEYAIAKNDNSTICSFFENIDLTNTTHKENAILYLIQNIYYHEVNKLVELQKLIKKADIEVWLRKQKKSINGKNIYDDYVKKFFSSENKSLKQVMQEIQSEIMKEEVSITEKDKKEASKKRINALNKIKNITISAILYNVIKDNYIDMFNTNDKDETMNEDTALGLYKEKLNMVCDIDLNKLSNLELTFYVFAKLLDNTTLNHLKNEYVKFNILNKKNKISNEDIKNCIKIFDLCLFTNNDKINGADTEIYYNINTAKQQYFEVLSAYADLNNKDDLKKYNVANNKLFIQDDDSTLIIQKNIENTRKYGTYALIKKINFNKLNIKDIENLEDYSDIDLIYKSRQAILQNEEITEDDIKKLKDYNLKIQNYIWLKNKLEFNDIRNINLFIFELLSRQIGWCYHFEKDMTYFLIGIDSNNYNKILSKNNIFDFLDENSDMKNIINSLLCNYDKGFRNMVTHLNFLNDESKQKKSLFEQFMEFRKIFSYNRKIKNDVTDVLKKILDRNGMELIIKLDEFDFKIENIIPKTIVNKKTKEKTNIVSQEYCDKIGKLLSYNKS